MALHNVGCGHGAVVARLSSPSKYIVRHIASIIWWMIKDWDVNVPFKFALLHEFSLFISEGCVLGTVAVIEVIGSDLAITAISQSRAVPSVNAKYFRERLIESNGEILLVFLIFQKTMTNVDQVEVFSLQVPKLRWVKMEEAGDRALFVEPESCIWVKLVFRVQSQRAY
ncbi:hypothetical protein LIER_31749 [Lithospermum erythrorhizon]|uniref:KIB1-4 beta-propeller domain-containing protein n=1 Tax=Lithospermum erythrorhizon TaxID=34254 RepID=A0AAV3RRW1_LITER